MLPATVDSAMRGKATLLVFGLMWLLLASPARAQKVEIAGAFGAGMSAEEDENEHKAAVVGFSVSWPARTRFRLQGDYLFSDIATRMCNRHYFTGSLVVQGQGQTRGFFQAGVGYTRKAWTVETGPGLFALRDRTAGVWLAGGGATSQLSRASPWFIRLEGRSYWSFGENITFLFLLSVGRSF